VKNITLRTEYSEYLAKRDKVLYGYRKLHGEELHNFSPLSNNIRTIKLRRMM
jgi:hypothetical protein